VIQKKPKRAITKMGYGNLKIEVIMDKSQKSKGQTKDFNRRRCLNGLYNNSSD